MLRDKLKLKTGERIFAYFFDDNGVRMRRFTIKGIYQTNLKKYDEVMVYTDLYTAVKLNGWEEYSFACFMKKEDCYRITTCYLPNTR